MFKKESISTVTIPIDEYRTLVENNAINRTIIDKYQRAIVSLYHEAETKDTVIEKYKKFFNINRDYKEVFQDWLKDEVRENAEN